MSISIKGYNNVALKINSNSSDQIVYKNHIYTLNNMDFEKNDNTHETRVVFNITSYNTSFEECK